MANIKFYYDETEHSRSLNLKTITADEFYDGFVTAIVGWDEARESELEKKYRAFEEGYRSPQATELKSTALAKKQFRYGFHSLAKANAHLVHDFLCLFDEDMFVYYSFSSKVEHLIYRLFDQYRSVPGINTDLMKYSLTKLVVQCRPREVVKAFYDDPEELISKLRAFLRDRIERNRSNPELKHAETEQCQAILSILDDALPLESVEWEYYSPLVGFASYLGEHRGIDSYELCIDREEKTAAAARELEFGLVRQVDSKECFGIRMADMLAGIIGKLLKAIRAELTYCSKEDELKRNLFDEKWFELNDTQLGLYKQLQKVLLCYDKYWYKAYAGVYSDDFVVLIALLNYLGEFEDAGQLRESSGSHAEMLNARCCSNLELHYQRSKIKAPWEADIDKPSNRFRPRLSVSDEPMVCNVVKVVLAEDGAPMVVVRESGKDAIYVLPDELAEWASLFVHDEDLAELLFPSDVQFQIVNGRHCADIL